MEIFPWIFQISLYVGYEKSLKKKRHIVSIISSHILLFHHSYSSANAKKWESEFQTLKNNNARLTAALQESAINVEKWKEQLNNYKEDNQRLRKKVIV